MKRLQASNLGVRRRGLMMGVMGAEVRNGKSEGTLDQDLFEEAKFTDF